MQMILHRALQKEGPLKALLDFFVENEQKLQFMSYEDDTALIVRTQEQNLEDNAYRQVLAYKLRPTVPLDKQIRDFDHKEEFVEMRYTIQGNLCSRSICALALMHELTRMRHQHQILIFVVGHASRIFRRDQDMRTPVLNNSYRQSRPTRVDTQSLVEPLCNVDQPLMYIHDLVDEPYVQKDDELMEDEPVPDSWEAGTDSE
ncbi:hypothetical protein SARC_01915 [Sphaeroforma arctica JP610]|uniref:Uncharacterized protein n=1 Tax=Sphaeroforma arctica JP610 TaxID=667725 RepID=A0A0L0GCD3_9EUKA|nr:hypothetical protein SARC_01915 [Sphaeroforma arctica JP610]KNC85923.1 hypothetical protein SARC_01915 [Sphaeroforma arctica JP610]|eukprot:XP_014159825.1 hypothetical protein SARC_01915 [Sphaeroforma arctica JP610]